MLFAIVGGTAMPFRVEVYTLGGIVTGAMTRPGHLRDILESSTELVIENASAAPLDGSRVASGQQQIAMDDVVAAVADQEHPAPVHAAWHPIRLEAGPWLVEGDLPTLPGFDPGRALTRPTGTFVLLRGVRMSLLSQPDAGQNTHESLLVNRYAVDRVDADLMLGFFFPGAHIEAPVAIGLPSLPGEPMAETPPAAIGSDA
jgi:hypothetical protein